MLYDSVESLVGHTPLVRLSRAARALGAPDRLFGKLEFMNPTGSAKDRPALFMIEAAERSSALRPGGVIIEPTSGNTGIGLTAIGAARGYRVILTMPDTMSRERIALLTAYGAEVVLTEGKKGMAGAIEKARQLARELPGAIIPGQFDNPENARAHEKTTGPEIARDLSESVGAFVAGVGTGGTLTGAARYLKRVCPDVRVIAVEPASSPLLSKGTFGPHGLQGIGANFVPSILDRALIDEILPVTDEDAFAAAKLLARSEGLLCGVTSGAALFAAAEYLRRAGEAAGNVVCVLPDSGSRYLSTGIYD